MDWARIVIGRGGAASGGAETTDQARSRAFVI
jgi:hypothetical protein